MSFSENLRAVRERRGLTQQQVAEMMNLDKSTYCGYETGKRQPDVPKLKKLSRILGVSGDELLETGYEKPTTVSDDGLWDSLSTDPAKLMLARWIAGLDQQQLERVLKLLDAALLSPKE